MEAPEGLILPDGRKMIMDSEEGISGKYRSSALKKTYAFNENSVFWRNWTVLIFDR
jgi:hypothetical protein